MNRTRSVRKRGVRTTSPAECLVKSLIHNDRTAAEALEFYYLSKEPGLLGVIRAIAVMPEETRDALQVFLAFAGDPKTVRARIDGDNVLKLSSVEVARNVALAQSGLDDELPHVLN